MESKRSYYQEFMEVYRTQGLARAMIYDLERTLERNLGVNIADSVIASAVEGANFVWSIATLHYTFSVMRKNIEERNEKSRKEVVFEE